jgi:transcriptional regulator with XRE-family HTH domain
MGLSQEEFARLVGLNRGNIASYEKQTAEPSIQNLSRIGHYFNIGLGELVEKDLSAGNALIRRIDGGEGDHDGRRPVEEILIASLEENQRKIEQFRKRSDEMARILEGFRQFHKFRMENRDGLSDEVHKLALDYEKLLDVLEDVLSTNRHMMELLEGRKNG